MSMEFLPNPKTLNKYEVVEHEFAMAFARYVNLFNMLERNIGLCIRYKQVQPEFRATAKQLDNLSFNGKLERLTTIVDQNGFDISKKGLKKDYARWLQLMDKSREARNLYVHGDWYVCVEAKQPIQFTPLRWVERENEDRTERMTMDEFLARMKELDHVSEQFHLLRQKYGI